MFDFADKPTAWIPIRWSGIKPNGDEVGENVEFEIEVLAEIVPRDEFLELFGQPVDKRERELEIFKRVVSDWRKVRDGGVVVPFTDDTVLRMLEVPNFANGFNDSYITAWKGRLEIREKNFEGSPEAGRADGQQGGKRPSRNSTKRGR